MTKKKTTAPGTEPLGKKARSRVAIMHAAKGLFEEKGVGNVTFEDIAEKAGMSRTTIFNHFATAGDLILALMDQEAADAVEFSEASGLKGPELIHALFDRLIDDMANYPALTNRLITDSILEGDPPSAMAVLEDLITDNLPDSMTGAEKEDTLILLSGAFYGMVNHYFIRRKPFDREAMKARFHHLTEGLY